MLFSQFYKSNPLPDKDTALPDRDKPIAVTPLHYVNGNPIVPPVPDHLEQAGKKSEALSFLWRLGEIDHVWNRDADTLR